MSSLETARYAKQLPSCPCPALSHNNQGLWAAVELHDLLSFHGSMLGEVILGFPRQPRSRERREIRDPVRRVASGGFCDFKRIVRGESYGTIADGPMRRKRDGRRFLTIAGKSARRGRGIENRRRQKHGRPKRGCAGPRPRRRRRTLASQPAAAAAVE